MVNAIVHWYLGAGLFCAGMAWVWSEEDIERFTIKVASSAITVFLWLPMFFAGGLIKHLRKRRRTRG